MSHVGDSVASGSKDESTLNTDTFNIQRQPLLEADTVTDSSLSDEEVGNNHGYARQKAKKKVSANPHIRISIDSTDGIESTMLEPEIPKEVFKTFTLFIFLFFAWVMTTTSLALTHERVPDDPPLPDITLDSVTYQPWGLDTSEIIIIVSTWIAFIVVLSHKNRFVLLRRIFFLVGVHYYYRAITMYVTVLPKADPNYACAPKLDKITFFEVARRVLKLLSGMGLSINGQHIYCGDYIYSGHTMTLITTCLVIKEYSPKRWFLLHWFSYLLVIAGITTLLLGRGHYSIDVIIAYYITTRVWWIYHTLAYNHTLKNNPGTVVGNFWWFKIFNVIEEKVPAGPLKNEYSYPIPDFILSWWTSRQEPTVLPS